MILSKLYFKNVRKISHVQYYIYLTSTNYRMISVLMLF